MKARGRLINQTNLQRRRQTIVAKVAELKADVDSWNENHPHEYPIQIVFDFTKDVEERALGDGS